MIGRLLLAFFGIVLPLNVIHANEPGDPLMEKRVALVVGNGAYDDTASSLKNPANDARSMAAKFRSFGIDVIEAIDVDYRGMREALRRFDRALRSADAGIFYYAGHALEYRRESYLLPTDAVLETEGDIGLGLINISQVLQVMETAVPTRLLFLDACRNNPLANRLKRNYSNDSRSMSVSSGLGRIDTAVGTFIAYATSPGAVAADGMGDNSPFTRAMLIHLDEPGLDISQLMQRVRNSVVEATNHKQIPWDSSSLRGPFILNDAQPEEQVHAALPKTNDDAVRVEALFWESIRESQNPADFRAYIDRFGDGGIFTPLARARMVPAGNNQSSKAAAAPDSETTKSELGSPETSTKGVVIAGSEDSDLPPLATQEASCRNGVAKDCAALGYAYYAGKGVEPQPERAAYWHALACTEGHAKSCTDLGYLHENGEGVDTDLTKAASFYQQGCEGNSLTGCANLAYLYERGRGVNKNERLAAAYYRRGCDGGYPRACTNLGFLYQYGHGVRKHLGAAVALYRKGCSGGNAVGCTNLGSLYEHGQGIQQDKKRAIKLYHQGCAGGDSSGCTDLGFLYEKGLVVDKDLKQAATLYQRGCNGGNIVGCTNLGFLHETGKGIEKDIQKADTLYRQGCDGGYPRACTNLGFLIESGINGSQDLGRAAAWYRKGCDGGNALGCTNLAHLYEQGQGVKRDWQKAMSFFEKACSSGLGKGCTGLANLKRDLQLR